MARTARALVMGEAKVIFVDFSAGPPWFLSRRYMDSPTYSEGKACGTILPQRPKARQNSSSV